MRGSFPRSLWWRGDWWWRCWCRSEERVVRGGRDPEDRVSTSRSGGHAWWERRRGRWEGAEGGIIESDNWGHLLNKHHSQTIFIVMQRPSGYIYTLNTSVGSPSSNLMLTLTLTYHILHVESVRFSVSYSKSSKIPNTNINVKAKQVIRRYYCQYFLWSEVWSLKSEVCKHQPSKHGQADLNLNEASSLLQ